MRHRAGTSAESFHMPTPAPPYRRRRLHATHSMHARRASQTIGAFATTGNEGASHFQRCLYPRWRRQPPPAAERSRRPVEAPPADALLTRAAGATTTTRTGGAVFSVPPALIPHPPPAARRQQPSSRLHHQQGAPVETRPRRRPQWRPTPLSASRAAPASCACSGGHRASCCHHPLADSPGGLFPDPTAPPPPVRRPRCLTLGACHQRSSAAAAAFLRAHRPPPRATWPQVRRCIAGAVPGWRARRPAALIHCPQPAPSRRA